MKAIRIHKFGPTEDVLQYEDVPAPEPKAGEILIKVEAASLNRATLAYAKVLTVFPPMRSRLFLVANLPAQLKNSAPALTNIESASVSLRIRVSVVTRNTPLRKLPKSGPSPTESPRLRRRQLPPYVSPRGSDC
jgi:hypothetical protein